MRALLDVNVLIALFDADHTSHQPASAWFAANAKEGWATCPITQNGVVRVMSSPSYRKALPVHAIAEKLREAANHPLHEAWPDDISLLDATRIDTRRIHSPKQLTDTYLLALAVAHGARLVTFDRGIGTAAVANASEAHLLVV